MPGGGTGSANLTPKTDGERTKRAGAQRGEPTRQGRAEDGVEPATRRHTQTTWLVTKSTMPLYKREEPGKEPGRKQQPERHGRTASTQRARRHAEPDQAYPHKKQTREGPKGRQKAHTRAQRRTEPQGAHRRNEPQRARLQPSPSGTGGLHRSRARLSREISGFLTNSDRM